MADVDQEAAVQLAFKSTWERLAEAIAEAKLLEASAARDPALKDDPRYQRYTRWTWLFDKELQAAQNVYDALVHGIKVPMDDLLPAYGAERRLLSTIAGDEPDPPGLDAVSGSQHTTSAR
jgi:hypothetical protein